MNIKSFLVKAKNVITDGYPDILWPWIMECVTILVVTIVGSSLIFNYLKYKGIL